LQKLLGAKMIPKHISDALKFMSKAQNEKFQELAMWANNDGGTGASLPIDYDRILDMVKRMTGAPIRPVEPPPVEEVEVLLKPKVQ
jgi:hypothetical protein